MMDEERIINEIRACHNGLLQAMALYTIILVVWITVVGGVLFHADDDALARRIPAASQPEGGK